MEHIKHIKGNENEYNKSAHYFKHMVAAFAFALSVVSNNDITSAHPTPGCHHAHLAKPKKSIKVYRGGRLIARFTYQDVVLARRDNNSYCRRKINENNTGPIRYRLHDYWKIKSLYPDSQVKLTREPGTGMKGHCFATKNGTDKVFLNDVIRSKKKRSSRKRLGRSRRRSHMQGPVYYVDPCLAASLGLRVVAGKCR